MRVVEILGILVLECPHCQNKFVVNTECVKQGFQWLCKCGRGGYYELNSQLEVTIRRGIPYDSMYKENQKIFDKSIVQRNAMPLDEYKALLAEFVINGRKPKIKREYKNTVSFDTKEEDVANIIDALCGLGFSRQEATKRVNISLKEGLRMEEEIIKRALSL